MRVLCATVVLAGALALVGCAGPADIQTPSVMPSRPSVAAPSTSPLPIRTSTPRPTPTPSQEELENEAYAVLAESRGKESIGGVQSAINLGRAFCANLRENYADDPQTAVASLIENHFSRDPSAVEVFCPEFTEALRLAETGFYDGSHVVGQDIVAGTYSTIVTPGSVGTTDCYWERSTGNGGTIANDFVTLAAEGVSVRLGEGEGFTSDGCGAWLPSN